LRTQRGVANHFKEGLGRAKLWSHDMKKALADQGVPPEVFVLPFVESMFNPHARSYCGALVCGSSCRRRRAASGSR